MRGICFRVGASSRRRWPVVFATRRVFVSRSIQPRGAFRVRSLITRGGLRSVPLRERRDIVPRVVRRARRRVDRLRRAFPVLFRLPAPVLGRVDGRLCVFVSARALLERRGPRSRGCVSARVRLDVHQERLALRRACSVGGGGEGGQEPARAVDRADPGASRVPLGRNSSGKPRTQQRTSQERLDAISRLVVVRHARGEQIDVASEAGGDLLR